MEQGNGGEGRSGERSPHRQFPYSDTVMHNHPVGTCSDGAGYSRRKPGDWMYSGRRAGERPLNASFRDPGIPLMEEGTHREPHPRPLFRPEEACCYLHPVSAAEAFTLSTH